MKLSLGDERAMVRAEFKPQAVGAGNPARAVDHQEHLIVTRRVRPDNPARDEMDGMDMGLPNPVRQFGARRARTRKQLDRSGGVGCEFDDSDGHGGYLVTTNGAGEELSEGSGVGSIVRAPAYDDRNRLAADPEFRDQP